MFHTTFYKLVVGLTFFLALFLIIFGFYLDETLFLNFSFDKGLSPQTIQRIHDLKVMIISTGVLFLFFVILLKILKTTLIIWIKKRKNTLQHIIIVLVIIIFFLAFYELILRFTISEETPRYGFGPGYMKFNKKYVHLNNEGFRDGDYSIQKNDDVCRIIGLGDSVTFGVGVKEANKTYIKIFESLLNNKREGLYETINFGKPGLNTKDELGILYDSALKYDPDVIVLGYQLGDFEDVQNSAKCGRKEYTVPYIGFWLRNVSYLYYFLEIRINRLIEMLRSEECNYGDYLDYIYESEKNREHNFKYLEELSTICKEKNVGLVVVTFPVIYRLQDYPFVEAHNFVEEAGRKYNFTVVDVLQYWQNYSANDLMVNPYDDHHPNELGQGLAGQALFEIAGEEVSLRCQHK